MYELANNKTVSKTYLDWTLEQRENAWFVGLFFGVSETTIFNMLDALGNIPIKWQKDFYDGVSLCEYSVSLFERLKGID